MFFIIILFIVVLSCGIYSIVHFYLFADVYNAGFRSKYIILFVIVICGSILLTTLMAVSEAVQKRREARKERLRKKEATSSMTMTNSRKSSSARASPSHVRDQRSNVFKDKDRCSSTTADSIIGTFRSSRINENVSFR